MYVIISPIEKVDLFDVFVITKPELELRSTGKTLEFAVFVLPLIVYIVEALLLIVYDIIPTL